MPIRINLPAVLLIAPPIGLPLAIYAISTEGFTEWFEGTFDGRHWTTRPDASLP